MASGSKSVSGTSSPTRFLQVAHEADRPLQLLHSPRGGEAQVLLNDAPVVIVVGLAEAHLEVEAAGSDEVTDGLEARRGDATLEAVDDRLRGADSLGELRLTETGSLPRLADQVIPLHGETIAEMLYRNPSSGAP